MYTVYIPYIFCTCSSCDSNISIFALEYIAYVRYAPWANFSRIQLFVYFNYHCVNIKLQITYRYHSSVLVFRDSKREIRGILTITYGANELLLITPRAYRAVHKQVIGAIRV